MRYLSSISLALVALMALACTATPATTPTPPGPTLTEREAIAVVKNYLGLKNIGKLQCGAYFDARYPSWTARYDGNGVWEVGVDIIAEEVIWAVGEVTKEQQLQRSPHPGKWEMYEKTKSVVNASDVHKC